MARGTISLDATEMRKGDGAAVRAEETTAVDAETDAEVLLFEFR